VVVLLTLLALDGALRPAPIHAHGAPVMLDFWGDFGRRTARCQRVIGSSAAACGLRAWIVRRDCALGGLYGSPCDQQAADAAIEAVHVKTANAVGAACSESQALTLMFLGQYEAQTDAVRFCRELETAAVSAVFLPLPVDGTDVSVSVRDCVAGAALVTTKLLHRAFGSRQRLLDRIALFSFSPRTKRDMLAASTAAISRDATALEAVIAPSCSADAFGQTFGRSPAAFLAQIASRADCLSGRTYAQGGILCPPAQCGNGMREPPDEQCDDGNLTDGDGCSAQCTSESPN
jgi:cysteine-rich repeat protein